MSPQLQWLGDIPKEDAWSSVAKAIQGGMAGFTSGMGMGMEKQKLGMEREKTTASLKMAQSELDLKGKQLEHDYAKLDYDKRKDMYDTMVKLLPNVPSEKQVELTSSPEWMTLEKSLGMPSLSGTTLSPEKTKPTWGQENEVASIRSDLMRGSGTTYSLMGEPEPFDMKTEEDALNYLSKRNQNPAMYSAELARFKTITPTGKGVKKGGQSSPYKEYPDAFQEGGVWKVMRGGKKYKIQE